MSSKRVQAPGSRFERVPLSSALLYGSATIPMNMVGTCLALHLFFFYTDTLGLAPLYVSAVMFIGSLWDAVSDQLMGQISDHTRWRGGRRRPYLLIAAVPFGVCFYLVLAPPAALSGFDLFLYLLVFRTLLYTAATMVYVPLYALAPEMAQSYHERTRLTAFREGLGSLGELVGMLAPSLLLLAIAGSTGSTEGDARAAYAWVGGIGLVLSLVFISAAWAGSYEDPEFSAAGSIDLGAGLRALRDNHAFRSLILATAFPAIAIQMSAGLFLYVTKHVIGITDQRFTSSVFVAYVLAALISYPLWAAAARRFGKPAAFRASLGMITLSYLSIYLLQPEEPWRIYATMAFAGAGSAGFWTSVFSQLADVADLEEADTGVRREGLYAGFASLARKIGYAIGGGAIGVGLWLVGYDETASVQSAETVFGLRLVFSVPTFAFAMLGLLLFSGYPITEASHSALLERLKQTRTSG